MDPVVWLIIFVVLLGIEIATLSLVTVWFAGGALVAFFASLLGAGFSLQLVLFFLLAIILLFFTRPVAVKYVNKNRAKTNVDAMVGKTGLVMTVINNIQGTGKVSIAGMEWTARAENDKDVIVQDRLVEVVKVSGVKVIVKEKKEEE